MRRTIATLVLSMLLWGCQAGDEVPRAEPGSDPVQAILKTYIQSLGGQTAVASENTRIIQGTWVDDRPYFGEPRRSAFTVWAHSDGRWRYASDYESFGVDSLGGWWLEKGYIRPDSFQKRSNFAYLFLPQSALNIETYFDLKSDVRKSVQENRQLLGVTTDRDTTYYTLWFDEESGELARIGYFWSLRDYRETAGIRFPTQIEISRKGGANRFEIDTLIMNQPLPDSLLSRPRQYPTLDE